MRVTLGNITEEVKLPMLVMLGNISWGNKLSQSRFRPIKLVMLGNITWENKLGESRFRPIKLVMLGNITRGNNFV